MLLNCNCSGLGYNWIFCRIYFDFYRGSVSWFTTFTALFENFDTFPIAFFNCFTRFSENLLFYASLTRWSSSMQIWAFVPPPKPTQMSFSSKPSYFIAPLLLHTDSSSRQQSFWNIVHVFRTGLGRLFRNYSHAVVLYLFGNFSTSGST